MKVFSLLKCYGARYETFTMAMLKPPMPSSYAEIVPLLQGYEIHTNLHDFASNFAFYGQRNSIANSKDHRGGRRAQHQRSFSSRGCSFHPANNSTREPNSGLGLCESTNPITKGGIGPSEPKVLDPPSACQICGKKGHVAL